VVPMHRFVGLALVVGLLGALTGSVASASSTSTAALKLTSVVAVSCPSSRDCFAGGTAAHGNVVLDTTDGGASWHAESESIAISVIDCPSATVCIGGGLGDKVLVTSDGGKTWTVHTVSSSLAEVQAVSCPTTTDCWSSGLATDSIDVVVYRSSDGGASWNLVKTPKLTVPMSNLSGVSCVNRDDCVVTGYGVLKTRDGGTSWSSISLKRFVLDAVACMSKSDCIAVSNVTSAVPSHESGSIYTTANFGSLWTNRLTGRRVTDLDSISCPSTSRCVSVGGATRRKARLTTTPGGRSRRHRTVAPPGSSRRTWASPTSSTSPAPRGHRTASPSAWQRAPAPFSNPPTTTPDGSRCRLHSKTRQRPIRGGGLQGPDSAQAVPERTKPHLSERAFLARPLTPAEAGLERCPPHVLEQEASKPSADTSHEDEAELAHSGSPSKL